MDKNTFEITWRNVMRRCAIRNKFYPESTMKTHESLRGFRRKAGAIRHAKVTKRVRIARKIENQRDRHKGWAERAKGEAHLFYE